MGTTLREIIYDIGGGYPERQGVQGGADRRPLRRLYPGFACWILPIDYDNLIAIGSMMGSGGMIVMDEDNCMVDIARFFLDFTVDESCGKCTALPYRYPQNAGDPAAYHQRPGPGRRYRASGNPRLQHKEHRAVRLGSDGAQPRTVHARATSVMSTRRTSTRSAVRRATARRCSTTRSIPRSARAAPHVPASARPARSPATSSHAAHHRSCPSASSAAPAWRSASSTLFPASDAA